MTVRYSRPKSFSLTIYYVNEDKETLDFVIQSYGLTDFTPILQRS